MAGYNLRGEECNSSFRDWARAERGVWGNVLGGESSEQSRWQRLQFERLPLFFTICMDSSCFTKLIFTCTTIDSISFVSVSYCIT